MLDCGNYFYRHAGSSYSGIDIDNDPMIQQLHFPLPSHPGKVTTLHCLPGAATAVLCADIIQRHSGLVLLVVPDPKSAFDLQSTLQAFSALQVTLFPDWETLPYDTFSPYQDIVSERLATLYHLPTLSHGALIAPMTTLMQRVCPSDFLTAHALLVEQGQHLAREQLCQQLVHAGYRTVDQVTVQGEFAVRGSLLDLFPMGSTTPYRLDFLDNEIETIRTFDCETQRSQHNPISTIKLLPAHEFATDPNTIALFRSRWRERFTLRHEAEHLYQQVSQGVFPPGIEYWQPLFFSEALPTLFSYLPSKTLLLTVGTDLEQAAHRFRQEIEQRFASRRHDTLRPLLAPDELWLRVEQLFAQLKAYPRVHVQQPTAADSSEDKWVQLPFAPLPDLRLQTQHKAPLATLQRFLQTFSGPVVFSVESQGRRAVLTELLAPLSINLKGIDQLEQATQPGYYLLISAWQQGFVYGPQLALICENDLLGERVAQPTRDARRKSTYLDTLVRHLAELRLGQAVVHLEHGIGRYGGLTTLTTGGIQAEYLILQYEDQAKLYVPVANLHLISRYSGGPEEQAPLHKLGADSWRRAREKAFEKVRDVAAELLDIYAQRAAKAGFAYALDPAQYQLFCQGFPFDETPDQASAIQAVLHDMTHPTAMDRLVCGDVGFGKTEVALRAAFLAVTNNKQVLMLVPTTLLAEQHGDTFRDRFANWPVRIEVLSRFRTRTAQQQIISQLTQGHIDILIGTHKVLQDHLPLHNLGLLIIDEEHRFGVQQKERMKAIRANIDILTLTATPIPRTLNMAMSGMRDLSIIATPPTRRLAVKTFVREYDPLLVREALLREILRGGQVYYLHNEVKTIEQTAEKLRKMMPEIRIQVGHGQMRERDLERVMSDFYHQRFHVLVCSTIIETGIDIPSANTIIIERADHFGLAQLHQLRGRVGRSHHQAYAYLLTPHPKRMTLDARKRLEAIIALGDLGIGFALASHDLEIRGAGELLGEDQSGQISSIGFSLYQELLHNAVQSLKNGQAPTLQVLTQQYAEIELRLPALLPEQYIANINLRLSFYKRIASTQDEMELNALKVELIDRFGLLPPPACNLFQVTRLRQLAQRLAIRRIECGEQGGYIDFKPETRLDPTFVLQLLQRQPQQLRLKGPMRLQLIFALPTAAQRLTFIDQLLTELNGHLLPLPTDVTAASDSSITSGQNQQKI